AAYDPQPSATTDKKESRDHASSPRATARTRDTFPGVHRTDQGGLAFAGPCAVESTAAGDLDNAKTRAPALTSRHSRLAALIPRTRRNRLSCLVRRSYCKFDKTANRQKLSK